MARIRVNNGITDVGAHREGLASARRGDGVEGSMFSSLRRSVGSVTSGRAATLARTGGLVALSVLAIASRPAVGIADSPAQAAACNSMPQTNKVDIVTPSSPVVKTSMSSPLQVNVYNLKNGQGISIYTEMGGMALVSPNHYLQDYPNFTPLYYVFSFEPLNGIKATSANTLSQAVCTPHTIFNVGRLEQSFMYKQIGAKPGSTYALTVTTSTLQLYYTTLQQNSAPLSQAYTATLDIKVPGKPVLASKAGSKKHHAGVSSSHEA